MSTLPKTSQPVRTSTTQPYGRPVAEKKAQFKAEFLFDRENYMWMLGGLALILIGFFLMAGGKSPNPHEFNYAEIYSFRRITLAPIVLLCGFAVEVYAIMKMPKNTELTAYTNVNTEKVVVDKA
ncbi:MAG: DUF3098 domain-containing protein [Taibaiella sp.]|nr:DUF3098 domain-containing protein [Taibaiella sp.]